MKKELLKIIFTTLFVFLLSSFISRNLPGNPIELLFSESSTVLSETELKSLLQTDQPFIPYIFQKLTHYLKGDFGISLISQKPVFSTLYQSFKHTLQIVFPAVFFGLLMSLFLGIFSAKSPRSFLHYGVLILSSLTTATPLPVLGLALLYTGSVLFRIFPIGNHWFLPSFLLSLLFIGFFSRLIQNQVAESLKSNAVRAARARGLSELKVLFKYGFLPSSTLILGYVGTYIGFLLGGTFVTETLFQWPGMGLTVIEAIKNRDYPLIEASLFLIAFLSQLFTSLGNLFQNKLLNQIQSEELVY